MSAQATQPSSTGTRARRKPILRVKTGCFTCRNRKKKCDESRPVCSGCRRNKIQCRWPSPQLPLQSPPNANDSPSLEPSAKSPTLDSHERRFSQSFDVDMGIEEVLEDPPALDADHEYGEYDFVSNALISLSGAHLGQRALIEPSPSPVNPSILPGLDAQAFELMGHYLDRTAVSMGNGSTTTNPFIVQLIPLSFANPIVRELMLSQSASHRAVLDAGDQSEVIAHTYYTKSIRLFRKAVNDYLTGTESNPLWVTIGALIMCFTETAKGDTNGVIFDHIQAVGPLVTNLLTKLPHLLPDGLCAFVTEYYIYTAIVSMISTDPSAGTGLLLSPDLEHKAQSLAESGYVGQLCGSWLSLLLLIPRIFDFGHRRVAASVDPPFPAADDFLNFGSLQFEITSFVPSPSASSEVTICGYIFQQAVHLYLLTALGIGDERQLTQQLSLEHTLASAFSYLEQLPASARINTSMCWALAVIGSCTRDEERRELLRQRLQTMFLTIGLGNISSTLSLLEHIWMRPQREQSPWIICQIMYEHEIWISFA
ncbi:Zinc finger protein 1 [Fusarium odoratissimum]|uniref:Zinc finger protein 1 n=1 Tax=Fusarium oxysporum f. sp. cubense (strain race 4) TaxID=2502994 RepID=N1RH78_FUSC4|nr:Zinc finger protein 1 [Fusarium odoratissimum]